MLTALNGYRVRVDVSGPVALGPAGETVLARRVDVWVTSGPLVDATISGYRTQD